jgi:tetratricopeptide (TPR) repeat protein
MSDGASTTPLSEEQRLAREREVADLARATQTIAKSILVALLAGLLLLALSQGWGYWQLPAFIAGGLFIAGLLVGFLFGIPKVAADGDGAQQHPLLTPNTNLEQISDWLTKIIVGLGLVELHKIPPAISQFVAATSPAFHSSSAAAALAVTIYFPILGFTSGFLITRLYLSGLIARADVQLGHARELWDKGFAKLQKALDKGKPASLSEDEARAVQAREKKLESTPKSTYTAKDWLERGLAAYAAQDLKLAAECFDAVVRDPEATQKQVAQALLNESAVFYQMTEPTKTLAVSDDMLGRFGSSSDSEVLQWVALAVYNKGLALMMLGRLAEALDTFNDDLVKRLEGVSNPQVREYASAALYFRGAALLSLERFSDALAVLDDDLIKRLTASQLPQVRELTPAATYSRGLALLYLGRFDDALAIFNDDLIKNLEEATRREVRELAPAAVYNKGVALLDLGRFDDALAIFNDDLVKRLEAATVPQVHDLAAAAEYNRGYALLSLGRSGDALKIFDDDLIARLEAATSPQARDLAPAAQYNKGMALFNLGRLDDARGVFDDDLIKRLESATLPQIRALAPLASQKQHDLGSHAPQ